MCRIFHTFSQLALLSLFILLPACADKPEDKPKGKEEESTAPKLVGRMASIRKRSETRPPSGFDFSVSWFGHLPVLRMLS